MAERLTSRVSFDRRETDTRFYIRSNKDWKILFLTAWLAFWVTAPLATVLRAVRSLARFQTTDWFTLMWAVGWMIGIVFASCIVLWAIGGKEVLRLTSSHIELTASIFGIVLRQRAAPFSEVRNLRYVPAHSRGHRRFHASSICYEDIKGTVRLGADLDDGEALAIIERMLAIHSFPKRDKALEYIDLNS